MIYGKKTEEENAMAFLVSSRYLAALLPARKSSRRRTLPSRKNPRRSVFGEITISSHHRGASLAAPGDLAVRTAPEDLVVDAARVADLSPVQLYDTPLARSLTWRATSSSSPTAGDSFGRRRRVVRCPPRTNGRSVRRPARDFEHGHRSPDFTKELSQLCDKRLPLFFRKSLAHLSFLPAFTASVASTCNANVST
jgi:hypothetical protein